MKTKTKIGLLVASIAMAAAGVVCADEPANPYVQSAGTGKAVTTAYGLCVRTGYWTPALAEAQGSLGKNCECDQDIVKCEAGASGEKVVLSADTLFAFNKAVLKPEGKTMLKELTSRMAGLDLDVVMVSGYADRIGGANYNMKLSAKRAEAVKSYLAANGVPSARIQAEGKGQADPVVDCPNPSAKGEIKTFNQLKECLQPNRRAVIEVVGKRQ